MNRYFEVVNPWWRNEKYDVGVWRRKYVEMVAKNFDKKLIQVITGLRRVGKSTIVWQVIDDLVKKGMNPKKILYFSAEEPVVFDRPLIEIINEFRAENGFKTKEKVYVFIDEIQFRDGWEREIKSLYDSEKIKLVLTGSSALLLSEKIAYLTGRYLKIQVFPLDFEEYLEFKNDKISGEDDFLLQKRLEDYLKLGGMPEYIISRPDRYLQTTVESILFKDLVTKFKIRNPQILLDLLYLLSDRAGFTTSSLKLARVLRMSQDTMLEYVDYLEKVYLIGKLSNYSTSRNKQIYNPNKIYFEDNGILEVYASKSNLGCLAENAIFNKLNRLCRSRTRCKVGYWYDGKREVDFILKIDNKLMAVESKWIDKIEQFDQQSVMKLMAKEKVTKMMVVTRNLRLRKPEIDFVPLRDFLRQDIFAMMMV